MSSTSPGSTRYTRSDASADLLAGATTAALLIPQAMAYATLAGLPPISGLYAALAPPVVYAALGTSRHLAVGPVALDSLLVAAALAGLGPADPVTHAAAAAGMALLVGGFQLLAAALRLGDAVRLLSSPVLRGFTDAAALLIGASQLGSLLGLQVPSAAALGPVVGALGRQLGAVEGSTATLGLGAVAALVVMRRLRSRALALVGLGVALGYVLGPTAGVALLGPVPAGLPAPGLPAVDLALLASLAPAAATIAVVSFLESFSSAQAVARPGDAVRPNRELLALGLGNAAAGLLRGYPIAGGLSRTAVNAEAGARTPIAGVVAAAIVGLTLLFLAPLLGHLPRAVLSAIILVAVVGLVDVRFVAGLRREPRALLAYLVTAGVTLALGVGPGLAVGVGASLLSLALGARSSGPATL